MSDRDRWLKANDGELARECREERLRAGGPGGQHRQKKATTLRLRHLPTGIVVHAGEGRSLEENRRRALRRLRERLACTVREPFDPERFVWPADLAPYRQGQGLRIDRRNPDWPRVVALLLDAVAASGGSFARAAAALELSTSQLVRLLARDEAVWRAAREVQAAASGEGHYSVGRRTTRGARAMSQPTPDELQWLFRRAGVRVSPEDAERVAAVGRYAAGLRPEVVEEPALQPVVRPWPKG